MPLLMLQDQTDQDTTPLASAVLLLMKAEQRFLKAFVDLKPIPVAIVQELAVAATATAAVADAAVMSHQVQAYMLLHMCMRVLAAGLHLTCLDCRQGRCLALLMLSAELAAAAQAKIVSFDALWQMHCQVLQPTLVVLVDGGSTACCCHCRC